jgi:DnaJ-class molecular chaperone
MAGTPEDQDREASEQDRPVECPVCHGGKLNFAKTAPCMCCKGAGEIPNATAQILGGIRADLASRLPFNAEITGLSG